MTGVISASKRKANVAFEPSHIEILVEGRTIKGRSISPAISWICRSDPGRAALDNALPLEERRLVWGCSRLAGPNRTVASDSGGISFIISSPITCSALPVGFDNAEQSACQPTRQRCSVARNGLPPKPFEGWKSFWSECPRSYVTRKIFGNSPRVIAGQLSCPLRHEQNSDI